MKRRTTSSTNNNPIQETGLLKRTLSSVFGRSSTELHKESLEDYIKNCTEEAEKALQKASSSQNLPPDLSPKNLKQRPAPLAWLSTSGRNLLNNKSTPGTPSSSSTSPVTSASASPAQKIKFRKMSHDSL